MVLTVLVQDLLIYRWTITSSCLCIRLQTVQDKENWTKRTRPVVLCLQRSVLSCGLSLSRDEAGVPCLALSTTPPPDCLVQTGKRVQDLLQATLQGGPPKRTLELPFPPRPLSAVLAKPGTAYGRIVEDNGKVLASFCEDILRTVLFPAADGETGEGSYETDRTH